MFLTIGFKDTDSIGIVGAIAGKSTDTYHFISHTQREHGRKMHNTALQAIPKWFTGYAVDVDTYKQAIDLTVAFRDGVQWANTAAIDGKIKIIHKGK